MHRLGDYTHQLSWFMKQWVKLYCERSTAESRFKLHHKLYPIQLHSHFLSGNHQLYSLSVLPNTGGWLHLVYCPQLYVDSRSPQTSQDKAQFAGNGASLVKNCNAGLGDLGASLRARRETAICRVVILEKGMPFPADDALHMTISRLAITCIQFRTVH